MNSYEDTLILEAEVSYDAFKEACNKEYSKLMIEVSDLKLKLINDFKIRVSGIKLESLLKMMFRLDKRKLKSKKDKVTVEVMFMKAFE